MEQEILKDILIMIENGIYECKSRKDKQILKAIKDYIERRTGFAEEIRNNTVKEATDGYNFDVGF